MMSRRVVILGAMAVGLNAVMPALTAPALAAARRSRLMQALDPDNDGTVSLDEAKKAASTLFDRLDRNHNRVLNKRELGGRVTPQEFAAADPDRDGTLTKDEFLTVVEKRFKAADPDNDGTIDDKEFHTRPGRALLRLLQF
jgi:Ca2+-binding EF-hand superfamily protein